MLWDAAFAQFNSANGVLHALESRVTSGVGNLRKRKIMLVDRENLSLPPSLLLHRLYMELRIGTKRYNELRGKLIVQVAA